MSAIRQVLLIVAAILFMTVLHLVFGYIMISPAFGQEAEHQHHAMHDLEVTAEATVAIKRPPVEILFFTAEWCQPCKAMKPVRDRLLQQGWKIYVVDVEKPFGPLDTTWVYWVKRYRERAAKLPHTLILLEGRVHHTIEGEVPLNFMVDALERAGNDWRIRHGKESIPFELFRKPVILEQPPQTRSIQKIYSRPFTPVESRWSAPNPTRAGCRSPGCAMCGGLARW